MLNTLNHLTLLQFINSNYQKSLTYSIKQYSHISKMIDNYALYKARVLSQDKKFYHHSIKVEYGKYQQSFNYNQEPPYIIKANQRLQQNFSLYNLKALFTLYKVYISNLKYLITNYLIKKDSLLQQKFEQIKALNDYDSLLHLITTFELDLDERTFLYNTAVAMNENDKSFYDIKAVLFNDYQILIHDNIERSL